MDKVGFYTRTTPIPDAVDSPLSNKGMGSDSQNNQHPYIDVHILLTEEEIYTLAARKKAQKVDLLCDKNIAAAMSNVNSAVPYIDPLRTQQLALRNNTLTGSK